MEQLDPRWRCKNCGETKRLPDGPEATGLPEWVWREGRWFHACSGCGSHFGVMPAERLEEEALRTPQPVEDDWDEID